MKIKNNNILNLYTYRTKFIVLLQNYASIEDVEKRLGDKINYFQSIWLASMTIDLDSIVYYGRLEFKREKICKKLNDIARVSNESIVDDLLKELLDDIYNVFKLNKPPFTAFYHDQLTNGLCLIYGNDYINFGKTIKTNYAQPKQQSKQISSENQTIQSLITDFYADHGWRSAKAIRRMVVDEYKRNKMAKEVSVKLNRLLYFYRIGDGGPTFKDRVHLFGHKNDFDIFKCKSAIFKSFSKLIPSNNIVYMNSPSIDHHIELIYLKYVNVYKGRLFQKYFPPIKFFNLIEALQSPAEFKPLFTYLHNLIKFLFPVDMFGSNKNRTIFYQNMKIILTANFKVYFTSNDLICNMDLDEMSHFYKDFSRHANSRLIMLSFLTWFYHLISSIISSKFYITETSFIKNGVVFYPYDRWKQILIMIAQQYQAKGRWKKVDDLTLNIAMSDHDHPERYIKVRFIPKGSTGRPISNYLFQNKAHKLWGSRYRTWHNLLKQITRATIDEMPDIQNLQGRDYMFHRIIELKTFAQCYNTSNSDNELKWYVVRGDFQDCYPSINLYTLYNHVGRELEYFRQRIRLQPIDPSEQPHIPVENFESISYDSSGHFNRKTTFVINDDFKKVVSIKEMMRLIEKQLGKSYLDKHIIKRLGKNKLIVEDLWRWIHTYIFNSFIFLMNIAYANECGLRQGGILSPDLCQIYMTAYYREHFSEFIGTEHRQKEIFFRWADDFLFITGDRERARHFLTKMNNTVMNLSLNKDKLKTNFDSVTGEHQRNVWITFFGRRVNCNDLSTSIDLEKHLQGQYEQSIPCNPFISYLEAKQESKSKLCTLCYPEMFDRRTTTWPLVVDNVCRRMFLQASRLATFICHSFIWRNQQRKLHTEIINHIVELSWTFHRMLISWKERFGFETDLQPQHVLYITARSFRMLWSEQKKLKARGSKEVQHISQFCAFLEQHYDDCKKLPLQRRGWKVWL